MAVPPIRLPSNKLNLPLARNTTSCAVCPSAMTDEELVGAAGKGIKGPTCAIKMLPLLRPDAPSDVQARTTITIAKGCDKFGQPALPLNQSARQETLMYKVGFPRPNPSVMDGTGTKPRSCQGCAHFVAPHEVHAETGWNAPLCLANGALLLGDRLPTYAEGCDKAVHKQWEAPGSVKDFPFMPEYRKDFGKVNPMAAFRKTSGTDPLDWPTDRPVTSKQQLAGIKAWRKIDDPAGHGQPVYLPIFNPEARYPAGHPRAGELIISEARRNKIPLTNDDEHPEDYIDHSGAVYKVAVMWRGLDETPAIWGQPGTGKTELFRHMAWLMAAPLDRMSITGSSELDDLAGKMHYNPEKGTYFEYGRLPLSWQEIGVLLIDEPNVGPPDVWQFIRPLTDNSKQLVLDMNSGERIKRHDYAFLGMAMNPAWDARNVGAATIGDADARRLMHIYMGLPPREIEKEIIQKRCLEIGYDPSDHLDTIMDISTEIREMVDNGDLASVTWGVANNIKVTKAFKYFTPLTAYQIGVLDYLEPSAAQPIKTAVTSHYEV